MVTYYYYTLIGRQLSAAALAQYEAAAEFNWSDYLRETNSSAAPLKCFKQVWRNYLFYLNRYFT